MFGHGWESAEGTIVDRRIVKFTPVGPGWDELPLYEFIVDIRMPDGSEFRTTMEEPHDGKVMPPEIGAVVRVLVEAKSQQVRFDEHDPTINTKVQWKKMREAPDSFADTLHQPPGTPRG
jgi:hypothetical protein